MLANRDGRCADEQGVFPVSKTQCQGLHLHYTSSSLANTNVADNSAMRHDQAVHNVEEVAGLVLVTREA